MFKIASLVAILTVISKILGLVRDLVIAHYFGTSMLADAFNMAYLFTGNFFIIFGTIGGPFYSSIIATLPKLPENKTTWSFINNIILKTTLTLSALAFALFLYKDYLLKFFIDPEINRQYFNITLTNIDLLLPLIIICGPIGIIFAVLNVYKKYFEPSLAPAVVNISLIAAVFIMGDLANGMALALGTTIGGLLSLGFQLPSLLGIRSRLIAESSGLWALGSGDERVESTSSKQSNADRSPEPGARSPEPINEYNHILVPALFSTGLSQMMVFVDGFFCKGLAEGSWTSLVLANRLIQLPLGVLLTAILVPLFPRITEEVAKLNLTEVKRLLTKALASLSLLCLPAIIIGTLWAQPLIGFVFERGAFDARSTTMVSSVFFYLCFSIIPYVFKDCFIRTCYSFADARSPMFIMIASIIIKILLNSQLVSIYGLDGIAISTVITSFIGAIALFVILKTKFKAPKTE